MMLSSKQELWNRHKHITSLIILINPIPAAAAAAVGTGLENEELAAFSKPPVNGNNNSSNNANSNTFNKRRNYSRKQNKNSCWYCGGPRHPRPSCPARDHICDHCHKEGHWESVCNSKPATSTAAPLGAIGEPHHDTLSHQPLLA